MKCSLFYSLLAKKIRIIFNYRFSVSKQQKPNYYSVSHVKNVFLHSLSWPTFIIIFIRKKSVEILTFDNSTRPVDLLVRILFDSLLNLEKMAVKSQEITWQPPSGPVDLLVRTYLTASWTPGSQEWRPYLTTSWTRRLVGQDASWKAGSQKWRPYLTTSWTRGLLGSTRRKAVMLVPPYRKSSRSTRCKSCTMYILLRVIYTVNAAISLMLQRIGEKSHAFT